MKLIDKATLVTEINELKKEVGDDEYWHGYDIALDEVLYSLDTLEVKEVDWNMLSELSRHLLAVEAHNVTPNYQGGELDLLERIGYPERFKAQKGE